MREKIYISFMLFIFFLSVSMAIYEAGRIKALEARISVLTIQIRDLQKDCRIAKQDAEFILKLITDNTGGKE